MPAGLGQRLIVLLFGVAHPLTLPLGGEQSPAVRPVEVAARWIRALSQHDLDEAVGCFHPRYRDHATARRGEVVEGLEQVRANFARLFGDVADVRAELLSAVEERHTVWIEWRIVDTHPDGTPMEFVGVNIFEVDSDRFRSGRIHPTVARAVPCAFQSHEVLRNGAWEQIKNGIPRRTDRIRLIE